MTPHTNHDVKERFLKELRSFIKISPSPCNFKALSYSSIAIVASPNWEAEFARKKAFPAWILNCFLHWQQTVDSRVISTPLIAVLKSIIVFIMGKLNIDLFENV